MRQRTLLYARQTAFSSLLLLVCSAVFSQPTIAYQPVISTGISQPMEVVTAPGDASGRLFIVQKNGVVRIWDGVSVLVTPFLNITTDISQTDEQGLLSMAFHPDYQTNGLFYLYYTNTAGSITVSEFQVTGDPATSNVADPTATPLVTIPKTFTNHNGGHLQFRPEGTVNYLYFATGDGGGANDPSNNAQNMGSLLGKMLRIDVDAATPTPEIWGWGLRNPFRWSFDRATGDIWIGDVGQAIREEVNYLEGGVYGANYGWACFEALDANPSGPGTPPCDTVDAVHVLPIFEYDNPPGPDPSSVVGGYVYRGTEFPTLEGFYMTTDFYSGELWLIEPAGPGAWTISNQLGLPSSIASFSETNDGSTIYAASLAGNTVYKVVVTESLPVTLVNFSGKTGPGYNDLRWTTETESNIDRYVIEYSLDARTWSFVADVVALNNGNGHTYSYRHYLPGTSKVYYRIQVLEQNARSYYSPVIHLRGDALVAKVYPTVVEGNSVNIIVSQPVDRIAVISSDGRQVLAKDVNGADGYFSFPLPSLTRGIYFLRISGKDFHQTEKIIIQ